MDFEQVKKIILILLLLFFFLHYITMNNQSQIMILIERIESFLMSLEVIFFVKKQTELEKNSIKRKLSLIL